MPPKVPGDRTAALTLKLLGGFEAHGPGGEPLDFPGRKARALLAVLAVSRDLRLPRERLATLLWERSGEDQARASLRQTLSEVRKALGDGGPDLLNADLESVWLGPEGLRTDVADFKTFAQSDRFDDLEAAQTLWSGEFLEGFAIRHAPAFDEWLEAERSALHAIWLEASDALIEQALAQGCIRSGVDAAKRMLASDPLRESTHRALMRLLAAGGNRASALEQYEHCRAVLHEELGASPDMETEALAKRIRDDVSPRADPANAGKVRERTPPERSSIAVLPFQNMSGDPEQNYFSDGISEDIITALSRYRSMFVVARNSSFAYRQKTTDVRRIAAELGVRYVLEGSVRRAGNRIRITAQLVDGESGEHVWAEKYDRDFEDIFAVQDDVASIIVSTTAGRVDKDMAERAARKPPENLDAYEHCLRGLQFVHHYTRDSYALARKEFEAAVGADSRYARPQAWLSYLHTVHDYFYDSDPRSLELALEDGRRALDLDGQESQGHLALAIAHEFSWQHEPAEHHFERGLALNPNDDLLAVEYARFLQYTGREMEGVESMRRAMRLNPFYPDWYWNILGRCWHTAGHYQEAADAFERIELPPFWVNAYLAACYHALGQTEKAGRCLDRALEQKPDLFVAGYWAPILPYRSEAVRACFIKTLTDAGIPE